MAVYTYSRQAAFDPNTSPASVAKSATGAVYDLGDTGFLTPLNATLLASNTVVTSIVSDANGMFPDFSLIDRTQCMFKSGTYVFVLTTTSPIPASDASQLVTGTVADARLPVSAQAATLASTYATPKQAAGKAAAMAIIF